MTIEVTWTNPEYSDGGKQQQQYFKEKEKLI